MDKTFKFIDEYDKLKFLVECGKEQIGFNDYINSLPKEKAEMMKEIRQYRNEVVFYSEKPEISSNLDKWIELLQEEIKNLSNRNK